VLPENLAEYRTRLIQYARVHDTTQHAEELNTDGVIKGASESDEEDDLGDEDDDNDGEDEEECDDVE
jgi:hypothetical protein